MINYTNKKYENPKVNELLDASWKTMREFLSKNACKNACKSNNDEIFNWMAIAPSVDLLKELGAYEDFISSIDKDLRFRDIVILIESFLLVNLNEEFEINGNAKTLNGKIGPFSINVPKTSKELFNVGIKLDNCLNRIDQIEEFKEEKTLIVLELFDIPCIACEFEVKSSTLICTQAKKPQNETLEPYEYIYITELEKTLADHLSLFSIQEIFKNQKEFLPHAKDLFEESFREHLSMKKLFVEPSKERP